MDSTQNFKKLTYDDLKLIHDIMPKPRPKTYWEFLYDNLQKYLPGCVVCRYKTESLIRIQVLHDRRQAWCQFSDEVTKAIELNESLTDELKLHAHSIAYLIKEEFKAHEPEL